MRLIKGDRHLLFAAAVLVVAGLALPARAAAIDEEAELKARALRLNNVTGDDPTTGHILVLVNDPAGTKKLLALAVRLIKEKPKEPPFQVNATYILARAAQLLRDVDTSEQFYKLNAEQALQLKSVKKFGQAFSGLAALYYENKKFEECEKLCREILELPAPDEKDEPDPLRREKSAALRRLVLVLAKQNKVDDAMKIVDALVKAQPDSWLTLELKAQVQREAGKTDDAAKTYEDILARIEKDKELKEDEKAEFANEVHYILSGLFVDMKQLDKAAKELQGLLKAEPDNPTYNNDLGYIWADHDMNLDESEKLIRKALEEDHKLRKKNNPDLKPEEDKDNAAYLDSLGWVLFKKKKYDEAKKYLLQAIEDREGQNIEILDHLAEVHMALGEKAKAIEAWKKGIEVAGSDKREQQKKVEVEKKLKAQQ